MISPVARARRATRAIVVASRSRWIFAYAVAKARRD